MRTMLIAVAVLGIAACTAQHSPPADTSHVATVAPEEGAFVVVRKAPPDTLFDASGRFCVVHPTGKFDGADVGAAYPCVPTAPDSSGR